MAHFTQLDENNIVLEVLVVSNEDLNNLPFPDSEPLGIAFLQNLFPNTNWAQTSYNSNFRVRYAAIGDVFYPDSQATPYGGFGNQKPYDDWVWDDSQCLWIPPVPYPNDGKLYYWEQEPAHAWILSPIQPPSPPTIIGA